MVAAANTFPRLVVLVGATFVALGLLSAPSAVAASDAFEEERFQDIVKEATDEVGIDPQEFYAQEMFIVSHQEGVANVGRGGTADRRRKLVGVLDTTDTSSTARATIERILGGRSESKRKKSLFKKESSKSKGKKKSSKSKDKMKSSKSKSSKSKDKNDKKGSSKSSSSKSANKKKSSSQSNNSKKKKKSSSSSTDDKSKKRKKESDSSDDDDSKSKRKTKKSSSSSTSKSKSKSKSDSDSSKSKSKKKDSSSKDSKVRHRQWTIALLIFCLIKYSMGHPSSRAASHISLSFLLLEQEG